MTDLPSQPDAAELDNIDEFLYELWEYGFNSNGDFPTEHQGRGQRIDEAKQAINAWALSKALAAVGDDEQEIAGQYGDVDPTIRNVLRDELRAGLRKSFGGENA